MEDDTRPCRVLISEYLSVTRRVGQLTGEDSKHIREQAENLICRGY